MLEECPGDMSWKSVETKRLKPSLCVHVYVCVCVCVAGVSEQEIKIKGRCLHSDTKKK